MTGILVTLVIVVTTCNIVIAILVNIVIISVRDIHAIMILIFIALLIHASSFMCVAIVVIGVVILCDY